MKPEALESMVEWLPAISKARTNSFRGGHLRRTAEDKELTARVSQRSSARGYEPSRDMSRLLVEDANDVQAQFMGIDLDRQLREVKAGAGDMRLKGQ